MSDDPLISLPVTATWPIPGFVRKARRSCYPTPRDIITASQNQTGSAGFRRKTGSDQPNLGFQLRM